MKARRGLLRVGLVLLAAAAAGACTAEDVEGPIGSVGVELELTPGVNLSVVTCELTGPEDVTIEIDVSNPGANVSFLKAGLPIGDYTVTCTATSDDGSTECVGSAEFTIEDDETTMVMLDILCTMEDETGDAVVVGEVDLCANVGNVIAAPLQTGVGGTIDVSVEALDADGDPTTIAWSNDCGGTFDDPAAAEAVFTCPDTPTACEINVAVSDGLCGDDVSFTVECVAAGLCEGVDCDDDNECTADSCNPEDGSCSNTPVADGTTCALDGETGMCIDGVCEETPDLCEGVDCDDDNECTIDLCNPEDGTCSNEPDVGAACTTEDGSAGTCNEEAACVVGDLCAGVDCNDDNVCTTDACDPDSGACTFVPIDCDDGNECTADSCDPETGCASEPVEDGVECDGGDGVCEAGMCVPATMVPEPVTLSVPLACRNSFNQALSEIPADITVAPLDPIVGSGMFGADISATLALGEEFLQTAANALAGFGLPLEMVTINTTQAEIAPVSGATGPSVLSELSPTPQMLSIPIEPGTEGDIPSQIAGPVNIPLSVETASYTAGMSGEVVAFCPQGVVPDNVAVGDMPMGSYVEVAIAVLNVDFACQPGTVNDNGTPDDDSDDFIEPLMPADDCVTFTVE